MRNLSRFLCAAITLVAWMTVAAAQDAAHVYQSKDGVTLPKLVKEVKPEYTQAAKDAGIQGNVILSIVVRDTGTVGDVEVTRSLDKVHGLDEAAVRAVRQWEFEPGTKDQKPVHVRVEVEMTFRLK
jgi:TonB family protein